MARPRAAPKDVAEIERKILETLKSNGGSMARTRLRETVNPNLRVKDFEPIMAGLIELRLVAIAMREGAWTDPRGRPHRYPFTEYSLVPAKASRRKKPQG